MKYSIYQIDHNKDKNRLKFCSYEETQEVSGKVDSGIYSKVWDGETCRSVPENINEFLEELFYVFNESNVRPANYRGRSLSVSDVIVVDGAAYFCDDIGFQPINKEWFE